MSLIEKIGIGFGKKETAKPQKGLWLVELVLLCIACLAVWTLCLALLLRLM